MRDLAARPNPMTVLIVRLESEQLQWESDIAQILFLHPSEDDQYRIIFSLKTALGSQRDSTSSVIVPLLLNTPYSLTGIQPDPDLEHRNLNEDNCHTWEIWLSCTPGDETFAGFYHIRRLLSQTLFLPSEMLTASYMGAPASGVVASPSEGHAFISYVREDSGEVDALQKMLEAAGIPVWRDTSSLWPGEDWRAKIRGAISRDALVFVACFSSHSAARSKSYQNEELLLAIEQLRRRQPDDPWLIPVRFDDCKVPGFDLGADRTLASIQRADLFGANREIEGRRLVEAVQRLIRTTRTA